MGSRAWDVYKPRKMDFEVGRPNDARQVRSLPIFVHATCFRPQKGQKEGREEVRCFPVARDPFRILLALVDGGCNEIIGWSVPHCLCNDIVNYKIIFQIL